MLPNLRRARMRNIAASRRQPYLGNAGSLSQVRAKQSAGRWVELSAFSATMQMNESGLSLVWPQRSYCMASHY